MSKQTDESNKSPGEMLTEARKSLGLSLADVAAMTRIPKAMLKHLEADRYDEYSAEVFARGHLRNYAREVQLDPELVLQAFERHTGSLKATPELDGEVDGEVDESEESGEITNPLETGSWFDIELDEIRQHVRPAHLVAGGLVILALFVLFGVLTEQRATAQKGSEFAEDSGSAAESWQPKENSEKSRWLLDKSDRQAGDETE